MCLRAAVPDYSIGSDWPNGVQPSLANPRHFGSGGRHRRHHRPAGAQAGFWRGLIGGRG